MSRLRLPFTPAVRDRGQILARLASRNPEDNRFAGASPTLHPVTGEDLDTPTFLRQGLTVRPCEEMSRDILGTL